jgi:hypothetical protein
LCATSITTGININERFIRRARTERNDIEEPYKAFNLAKACGVEGEAMENKQGAI